MSAFRISINGTPWFDSDDLTTLTMAVEELRQNPRPRVSIHAAAGEGPIQWLDADLKGGDAILIEVVDDATEADSEADACSFCGRSAFEVAGVVASRTTRLCTTCVADFDAALSNSAPLPIGASFRDESEWVCGFCGKRPKEVPGVVVRSGAAICPQCVHACSDILPNRS